MSGEAATRLVDLAGLREWCAENGFAIEEIDASELALDDEETGSVWSVFRVEDWIQVKGLVLDDIEPVAALGLTLARLHDRLLGCRFALDPQHGLLVIADIYPACQSSEAIGTAIMQMQAIIDHVTPLFDSVIESGESADERTIDQAFGFEGSRRLH